MAVLTNSVLAHDIAGVRLALTQGADPNELDADGRPPLVHAVIDNALDIATLLLDSRAHVGAQDDLGNSALHFAAQEYHLEMASLLIEYGAPLEIEDKYGNTPLWRAVFNSYGRGEMISGLLKAGADMNHKNRNGRAPIDLARTIANYDVAQFF